MIYPVREDTLLLKENVEKRELKGKKVLEIGTGNGLIARTMMEKGAEVTATDINPEALSNLPEKINVLRSDLFEEVEGVYDLVVFNPPYLPEEHDEDLNGVETWLGGKKGIEVTERFLENVSDYLEEGGEALIIVSSLAEYRSLVEEFDLEVLDEEKFWFEKLFVMRLVIE